MRWDTSSGPSRSEWPFPPNQFVRASRLVEDGATDEQVRRSVERFEDGDGA